ncbi:MAG: C1 family peptidase [Lachnospiraceae bacterium]|nr:C1 family peptidase [Lachnospiraceae bacterium]
MKEITKKDIEEYQKSYAKYPLARSLSNVLAKTNLKDIVFCQKGMGQAHFHFSVDVKTLPVTNQKQSGRCWIFSALNVLREEVAKKCKLDKFELSQNYVAFWDKYEKINYFLETMIELMTDGEDGLTKNERLITYLLDTGIQDGGQWDMFVNVVTKYGVVPKTAMEETFQSSHTPTMNRTINSKLRRYAAKVAKCVREAQNGNCKPKKRDEKLAALAESMRKEMYTFLCECFGEPATTFDFEYVDKDKKYHVDRKLTPKSFYKKYVCIDLVKDYVSIVNSPTADKPFYKNITIDYLGNVVGGNRVQYLNLPMDEMKDLIVRQLKNGSVVWFGSDVSLKGDREAGIWSEACFDYEGTLGMKFEMSKEDRLNFRESAMNHAMVITGVNLDEKGQPTRWKIQNSWGEDRGEKGFYLMDAKWFDNYVFQAVVKKEFLSKEQLNYLEDEPNHYMPWDPMGTLAQ